MPFHLWEAQAALLADIARERLLLILKARQLGISWLVCAYAVWLCLKTPNRLVLFFSIGQTEANEMMRRVQAIYDRLGPALRAASSAVTKRNTEEIAWANGSRIESLPSRKTAGSGYTASLVVLDEWAKNINAEAIYTAVKPTIDGGGALIILSSAHGRANLFYQQCQRAIQGMGRFVFRFLPWWVRPGRDAAWYATTEAESVNPRLMRQEYPATADEAFEASDGQYFTAWDETLHTCAPFPIPADWRVWGGFDYGFSHNTAFYLLTEHDGVVYIIGEHVANRWLVAQHVPAMAALCLRFGRTLHGLDIVAGHDVFAQKGDADAKTIAQQYEAQGVTFRKAQIDRVNRAQYLAERLGNAEAGLAPTIKVFSACARLIACVPAMPTDPNRPEDVKKTDADSEGRGGDDAYDGASYGLMEASRPVTTFYGASPINDYRG